MYVRDDAVGMLMCVWSETSEDSVIKHCVTRYSVKQRQRA